MSSIALVSFTMGLAMAPAQEECMLLMVLDGMRSLESVLWNGLLAPYFVVSYEEEAMAKRRSRNVSMLSLVEGLHVFTRKPLQLQKRSHAHYGGTTLSQIIGPVVAPDWASEWRLQPAGQEEIVLERWHDPGGRQTSCRSQARLRRPM